MDFSLGTSEYEFPTAAVTNFPQCYGFREQKLDAGSTAAGHSEEGASGPHSPLWPLARWIGAPPTHSSRLPSGTHKVATMFPSPSSFLLVFSTLQHLPCLLLRPSPCFVCMLPASPLAGVHAVAFMLTK